MNEPQFQLSIEELAYAMGVLGGVETAGGFLLGILGEREQSEIDGRLLAAGHSLIAHGLLDFELAPPNQHLDLDLAHVVQLILQHSYAIRCIRATHREEQTLTFFCRETTIVEHQIHREVVSYLRALPGVQALIERSRTFFTLPNTPAPGPPLATLPAALLEDLKARVAAEGTPGDAATRLIRAGLPSAAAQDLAASFVDPLYRGTVLRVEPSGESVTSNRGFLLLCTPRQAWIFDILADTNPPLVQVYWGSQPQYSILLQRLLH